MSDQNSFIANIEYSSLRIYEQIGKGAYGAVFSGIYEDNQVAIKMMFKENEEVINKEIRMMKSLTHPNICLLLGISEYEKKKILVTELADNNLYKIIFEDDKEESLIKRLNYGLEAAKGIRWLHANKVIHRDIKLENILIKKGTVKVTDFGLSDSLLNKSLYDSALVGTPLYIAPELFGRKKFDHKIDVYAFGIVLYQLFERKKPFEHYRRLEDLTKDVIRGARPKFSAKHLEKEKYKPLIDLIKSCWDDDPLVRPEFVEIENTLLEIMASLTIPFESQRKFWIDEIGCYEIEFDDFFNKFIGNKISKKDPKYDKCYQSIKNCIDDKFVNIEKFGTFIMHHWREELNVLKVVDEIIELYDTCFHGKLINSVETILKGTGEKNSYLLRYSNSKTGAFALSVKMDNTQFYNYLIKRDIPTGKYILIHKKRKYSDKKILDLVQNVVNELFEGAIPFKREIEVLIYPN